MNDRLLTASEIAERLQVKVTWVYDASRRGELPSVLIGRYRRVLWADVEKWIERKRRTR